MKHHEAVVTGGFPKDLTDREKKLISASLRLFIVCYEEAKRDPNPKFRAAGLDYTVMTLRENVDAAIALM